MFNHKKRALFDPEPTPLKREGLRPRLSPVCYDENPRKSQKSPKDPLARGLSFRFTHEPSDLFKFEGVSAVSVMTPERSKKIPGIVHPCPTGVKEVVDYRADSSVTPVRYDGISKDTPFYRNITHSVYTVRAEEVQKPKSPRFPSNQKIFKESAAKYAQRKGVIVSAKKKTAFELCHDMAYMFLRNRAQTKENIFVQTSDFNSQQLAIENVILKLAVLLGSIELEQICERFPGGNIGKSVSYFLKLPGCAEPWRAEVKAENAHIRPHEDWTKIYLKLIAAELMKSDLPDIVLKGKSLDKDLSEKHEIAKKKTKEKIKKQTLFEGLTASSQALNESGPEI